jgi:FSR family fosmidomycin resistance protein-like MFS transporter
MVMIGERSSFEMSDSAKMNLKIILILSVSHIFVDLTGSALPVILPFLKGALQLNYTQVGVVIMVSNITSSIIQPVFGYLSDRREMKWILPASILLIYGGFSFIGFSPSYLVLLLFVMISGVGVACYHPEGFKTTHFFVGSRMATGMSIFQSGGALGMAFGPLVMTLFLQIAHLSGTLLFLVVGAIVLSLLLIYFKELTPPSEASESHLHKSGPVTIPSTERRTWISIVFLVTAVTLRSGAHMGLVTFVPFYYINVLHGDPLAAGRLVFTFLIGGAVGTLSGGIIADRIGHKLFFSITMILTTPLLFLLLQATGGWVFVVIFFIGIILISSFSVTVVMGQRILANRLGMASGLMLGFVIGMGGIGAGLLGIVADTWGILTVMKIVSIMPLAGFFPVLFVSYPPPPTRKKNP